MKSGRLRHRVLIEQASHAQDIVTGADEVSWTTFLADVPAEVLTGPGREFDSADSKQSETAARITLRWFPGLEYTMRVVWEGNVYDITSIDTDPTGRIEYRLRLVAGANEGI